MIRVGSTLALLLLASPVIKADDWPQWMGPNRDAVWAETGVLRTFAKSKPKLLWKSPIHGGFAGPAVAGGRVYVTDRVLAKDAKNPVDPFDTKQKVLSTERVLCLDAKDGKLLWKHEYKCPYYEISYPAGPRCTPTVSGGKVYALGAMGDLVCLDAKGGTLLWSKNFLKNYIQARGPTWGFCGHPLVYKNLVICNVGGQDATTVAFDKDTGAEKWKALSDTQLGCSPPTLIHAGGVDQCVIWTGKAIHGLDPSSGKIHWSMGLEPLFGMAIMAPRQAGDRLYAAGIGVAVVLKLDPKEPKVSVLWQETLDKIMNRKPRSRGIYSVNMTPFIDHGTVYGVDQPGMLRAMELESGKKLWFTFKPVIGREALEDYKGAGSGTAFIVKNGDRYFLFSETGELVIAKLSPKGYEELSRAKLVTPTGAAYGRHVVWSHPAFANKCIYVRNDKEIACYSLAE